MAIYMIVSYIFAWKGIELSFYWHVILFDYVLYLLATESPKYNCRYMRAIPLNMMFTDSLHLIDDWFNIIPKFETYLIIVTITWTISIAITLYLAISHFKRIYTIKNKRNKLKNNG